MTTRIAQAKPMPYHGPGWTVDVDDATYKLWAPTTRRPRWAAHWHACDGTYGDYAQGDSAADALDALDTCSRRNAAVAVRALLGAAQREESTR